MIEYALKSKVGVGTLIAKPAIRGTVTLLVVTTATNEVCLMDIGAANRWCNPIPVEDTNALTVPEMERMGITSVYTVRSEHTFNLHSYVRH